MKAAVYHPGQGIVIEDRPIPQPQRDELVVKVAAAGICGSDMHYYKDGHIGDWWIRQPHVLGHEFSGTVSAVGEDVELFAVGDPVVIEPIIPCGKCSPCKNGLYNLCLNLKFTGSPHTDGAFQEYVVTRPQFTYRIPASMPLKRAALVEPTSIAVHAIRQSGLQLGDSVAVIGAGPIGLLTLAVARISGAGQLYISDLDASRLAKAKEIGATEAIDARSDVVDTINAFTDGAGVDIAFEAVGIPSTVETALHIVRPGGKVVIIGVSPEAYISINMALVQAKEVTLIPVYLGRNAFATALDLLASERLQIDLIVTHTFPLTAAQKALDTAVNRYDDAVKVMFDMEAS